MNKKIIFSSMLILMFALSSCGPAPQATLPPDLAPDKHVVGYYGYWAPERGYFVSDIPVNKITHLNYAFSNVSEDGKCILGEPAADVERVYTSAESVNGKDDSTGTASFHGNFNQVLELKVKYPYLKVFISVGGYAWSANFSNAALSDCIPPNICQVMHRFIFQSVQRRVRWYRHRLGISGDRRPHQRAAGRQA